MSSFRLGKPLSMNPRNIKARESYHRNYEKNKEHIQEEARRRYHADPERYAKYRRDYFKRHPNYLKEYYAKHHKVSVTNKNRTSKMWNAQVIASETCDKTIPLI